MSSQINITSKKICQFIDKANNLMINCHEDCEVYFRRENIRKGNTTEELILFCCL